jgi:hypothetical protein
VFIRHIQDNVLQLVDYVQQLVDNAQQLENQISTAESASNHHSAYLMIVRNTAVLAA